MIAKVYLNKEKTFGVETYTYMDVRKTEVVEGHQYYRGTPLNARFVHPSKIKKYLEAKKVLFNPNDALVLGREIEESHDLEEFSAAKESDSSFMGPTDFTPVMLS